MVDGGLSCPLCLVANDPADMLGVVIEHAVPVPDALIGLCKRCVLAIVKTAMATELISPAEVFGDLPAGAEAPLMHENPDAKGICPEYGCYLQPGHAGPHEEPSNARLDGLGGSGDHVEPDSAAAPAAAGGPLVLPDSEAAEEAETPARPVRRDAD